MELHPWNVGFTWSLPERGPRAITPDQRREFDERGFVVVPGVLEPDVVAAARDDIDEWEAQTDAALRRREGGRLAIAETGAITFTVHLVTRSPRLRAFACHPFFVALAVELLGPDVNLYWDQAVYKKPEKPRRFPWHQDNGYTFVEPQQYLTCWVPLTPATIENGCPQVVPGVHRIGTLRHQYVDPLGFECFRDGESVVEDAVAAPAGLGDVVVFSSLTPHLTGPNTTPDVRKAYILQYAPAGSEILRGDPDAGPPVERIPCDDPDRQFAVARAGRGV